MSKKRQEIRDENRKQAELAAKKNRKINLLVGYGTALAFIGLVAITAFIKIDSTSLSAVKTFTKLARNHVTTPVKYAQTPPVGGNHSALWLNCGIYNKPVPNENAVHSMEHGAVWITYDPKKINGNSLTTLQKEIPSVYAVLSPYPGIKSAVVASAWGKQLSLNKVDDLRLTKFITLYANSPKAPEAGGECTGGLDAPGRIA